MKMKATTRAEMKASDVIKRMVFFPVRDVQKSIDQINTVNVVPRCFEDREGTNDHWRSQ
jgi:hypothetical protein